MTINCRWRRVLVARQTGIRPTITVRAQGVPWLTLTPDHKLWARVTDWARERDGAERAEPTWVPAEATLGGVEAFRESMLDSQSKVCFTSGMNADTVSAEVVIERLGGTQATAELCEVTKQAVSQWRTNGIPRAREMYLRAVRPDVFSPPEKAAAEYRARLEAELVE